MNKHIFKKTPEFYLISLFFSGITGYIFLATCNGLTISQAMIHPAILTIFGEICCFIWLIYAIYLQIRKKIFDKKSFVICFLIIPALIYSMIGQLGNSEALKILLGNSISQIYYILFIITYFACGFLVLKKQQ